jgi:hypothetical protein
MHAFRVRDLDMVEIVAAARSGDEDDGDSA